ncbi:hypothetical protein [Candidatus Nitrotoga arctica]|uniref:hypothetical protein n=1 Tax=Candidatus Nitrotoga arctica TaxID=453162 RepID=UPI001EFAB7EC|nr:hypothetical protein [Candidatus Nitrotoga arctica]
MPQDTYVCHNPGTDLKKIRDLPFVTWVNTYLRGFKIHPALISTPDTRPTRGLLAAHAAASGTLDRKALPGGHRPAPRRHGGGGARQNRLRGRSGRRRHQVHGQQGPADRSHPISAQTGRDRRGPEH